MGTSRFKMKLWESMWILLGAILLVDGYGPEFSRALPHVLTFSNSTGGAVHCLVTGEPRPTVTWIVKDGEGSIPAMHDLVKIHNNGTLQFLRFPPERWTSEVHDTEVRCRAENSYGVVLSATLHIRAVIEEDFLIQVVGEPVVKLNTGILKCQVPPSLKHQSVVVSWKFGNNYIYPTKSWANDLDLVMVPSGELHISSVDYRHTHHPYFCIVRNTNTGQSQESLPYHLTVRDVGAGSRPEQMADQEFYISVDQGQTAALPCRVQATPPPSLSWFYVKSNLLQPVSHTNRIHSTAHMLVITDAQLSDSGQYRCTARNEVGELSITIHLQVEPPLVVEVVPSEQIVDIGRQARLECLCEERDRASIIWRKDGIILSTSANVLVNRESVQIFSMDRNNYGMYQCFVNRGNLEMEARGQLRLGDAAPVLVYEFIDQTIQPGPPVCLKCSCRGSPTPQITWKKNGIDLHPSERILIGQYVALHGEVISHVNISSSRVEDGGLYTCTAENRAGQAQHSAKLNIYGSPMVHPMPDLKGVVGKELRVFCPASGYPLETVFWEKVGGDLKSSGGRVDIFNNGTMVIHQVASADAGKYKCTATSRQGLSSTQSTTLRVIVPPKLQRPGNAFQSLKTGQRVSLLCSVIEGDEPIGMSWLKDGRPVIVAGAAAGSDSGAAINQVGHDSILRINQLAADDAGNYTCRATNDAGSVFISFAVQVKVPPFWRVTPTSQSAIEGQTVTFPCEIDGVPPPIVTWTVQTGVNKRTFSVGGASRRTDDLEVFSNGSLVVWRVGVQDQGDYACSAQNGVGESVTTTVQLKINAPPRFMMEREGILSVHQGKEVELVCTANGDQPISIAWRKAGRDLNAQPGRTSITVIREVDHVTSKFIVEAADKEDSGRYECQASNPFGKSFYHIQLQIWEPPDSPGNVSLAGVTSRTARLAWALGPARPKIDRFVVQWKKQTESWEGITEEKTFYGEVEEAMLVNLKPATNYNARIFAENELGRSKEGKVVEFTTDGERPEGSPRNIRVSALSTTDLEVMWDQPDTELCHGTINRYNVGIRDFGQDVPYMFYDVDRYQWDRTRHHFRLRRLKKFSKYELVVQAVNKYGEGPLSDIVLAQTLEAAPEDAPEGVECQSLSSTGLHVKWRAPPHTSWNGQIRGYRVLYVPYPRWDEVPARQNTARQSAVIGTTTALSGLIPYTNYSIQVLAYTAAGDGPYSTPVSCSTEEDVPGPPRSIKVVVSGSSSIIVSWLPPHHTNGRILRYTVIVREIYHGHEKSHTKHDRPPTSDTYEIVGLRPGSQHQVWVQAFTSKGEGRSSQVVTKTPTHMPVPQITSIGQQVYQPWGTPVHLSCRHAGTPPPITKWFFQGKEASWVNQASAYGRSQLSLESARLEDSGNYTCNIEDGDILDSISYTLKVQVTPRPPIIRVHRVTSNSITLRWTNGQIGHSPIIGYRIRYKITYGEWEEKQVSFYAEEDTLTGLYCGRQYHLVLYQSNYIGESEASQIVNTRTVGEKPVAPSIHELLLVNSTSAILLLERWEQTACNILYFVLEYKLAKDSSWTVVTNNLLLQDSYSIRGLMPATAYDLRVTAHNHAGSTTTVYQFVTLDSLGTALPRNRGIAGVLDGLGFRATLSIFVSVICLVLASLGVCFCIRKKHVAKRPGRYDEIPKSSTMENRQNLEQQFYATVQRKTPALTPFASGCEADTIEQLKKAVRSKVEKIPQTASDISPYATSNLQTLPMGALVGGGGGGSNAMMAGGAHMIGRANTLGRGETLRLTDYHRQGDTVRIRQQATWQRSKGGRVLRRRYSESEEYDSDSDSRTESANQLDQHKFNPANYRTQFNL